MAKKKYRLLPLDYLKKINKDQLELLEITCGFPERMKNQLSKLERQEVSISCIRNRDSCYKHMRIKLCTIEVEDEGVRGEWTIPYSWVVRI